MRLLQGADLDRSRGPSSQFANTAANTGVTTTPILVTTLTRKSDTRYGLQFQEVF